MAEDETGNQPEQQKAAHDMYVLRFLVDDLWRDYHSVGGREVLWLNWELLNKLSQRLHALSERLVSGSESNTTKGRDCAADQ